jgi:hypothetical protein
VFLLVLNENQSFAFLGRPWISIALGSALTGIAAFFGGLSIYLAAALILPVLECALRYGSGYRVPRAALLPLAVVVLLAHAAFLAFMQDGTVGAQKVAVNIAYVFTIVVGAEIAGLIFRRGIVAEKLPKHAK